GKELYDQYIRQTQNLLMAKGLNTISEGDEAIFIKGPKLPLVDITALWRALEIDKADRDNGMQGYMNRCGYGAVKYAHLKNNRLTNYTCRFDQMLDEKDNTAVYLLYTYARICLSLKASSKDVKKLKASRNLRIEERLPRFFCRPHF
ncbi:arginine--tRNA ligase, cytoplasmic-like protein, partial [Tanacetum coccineum]